MKGWKITAPSTISEQEIVETTDSSALSKVKITKALITLSDVLSFKGEIESNNVVLGRAGIGIVAETGTNLFGLEKGKHVYIERTRECLECQNCKGGQFSKCSNLPVLR